MKFGKFTYESKWQGLPVEVALTKLLLEQKSFETWRINDHDVSTSFLDHATWMQVEWIYYWRRYIDVWITYFFLSFRNEASSLTSISPKKTNFCWSNWKINRMGQVSRKNERVVLLHARTYSKIRWEILRTDKQESKAALQSFRSLLGWLSSQLGRTWISRITFLSILLNCFEILVCSWHELEYQTLYGLSTNLQE